MTFFEVRNLTKRFGGLVAVNGVSFQVNPGEVYGLIGPNGAGKTTIFNLINGFFRPTAGQVLFRGEELSGLKPNQVCRKGIARTFQMVRPLFRMTVLENVMASAFVRTSSVTGARRLALETLEFTGLAGQKDVLAKSLTLGGRKRLEMTRALATQPQLLLLDEVVAGLNPTETNQVIEMISKIRSELGITVLIIEHVMKVIMTISDRVAVIHHGAKIVEGTPAQVVRDQGVIEAYLGEAAHAQG